MKPSKRQPLPPKLLTRLDTRRRDASLRAPKPSPRTSPARQGSSRAR